MGRPRHGLRDRLKRVAGLVAAVRFARALATPLGRGRLRAERGGARLFQPATVTWMDRHPALFALAGEQLAGKSAPRLLSFGCSTGEEAFTLARYFPDARIDAIDANPACIAQARRAQAVVSRPDRIRFACSDSPDLFANPYDAIFCLSVLRHGDLEALRPDSSTALMPFERFAGMIDAFDRCLMPGGLLILWGCNFRFADTATARHYRVISSAAIPAQPGPFYGADDRLLPEDRTTAFLFVKMG